MSDFDETYGSSVNARMAARMGEVPPEPVDDLERVAIAGPPPVPGAQWDELHQRWECWDEDAQAWLVVGNDGDGIAPADENPLTPMLARELLLADELEAEEEPVADVDRAPEPTDGPPGAQWNEVADRWERWDEATEGWVVAAGDPPPPGA